MLESFKGGSNAKNNLSNVLFSNGGHKTIP